MIDAALCDKQIVPTPAEIKSLAESTPDPAAQAPRARASCLDCDGTGWRHFWALATWQLDSAGQPIGKAVVTEIQRPEHIAIVEWQVSGDRIARAGDGQQIYSMVERCHCTRS
ncbi:hypothetical protein [Candidatus Roseilinea sp. NK_OTU-006]|uniref:hypothetical protein n=1 Tax=Candidatus Roseilinea sp. NK_OTU-006 TaxID=2704250 RepID=UPI00145D41A6|nr:hypothetical protein [Candidatus Roseilinea sp. NK_OTU-006]